MGNEHTIIGLVALIALVVIGVPIYLSILVCASIILMSGQYGDPITPITVMFNSLSTVSLLAIPLFILLGQLLAYCGAGKPLINLLNAYMGHLPGGPAYALIFASVIVAAMCASPVASVAAFGPLIIPILVGLGYSESFAVGLLISSATLAPLIPPNIVAIIYSFVASPLTRQNASVISLWTASIIPGLLIVVLLCIVVYIHSRRGHFEKLPSATWSERGQALKEGWAVALTPVAVLVPLYADWATPTEVSAIGLVYVFLISVFIYRGLNWNNFRLSCSSTLTILGALFVIFMAATLLNLAFAHARVPQDVTSWIKDMGLNWWTFMLVILLVYTVMGMFLDPTAIIIVSVPMLMPTIDQNLGINVIAFGVFTAIAVNLAGITPPYGLTIFASQTILGKPYTFIVRSCLLFYPAVFIGMCFVAFIPGLSTWLPNYTGW